MMTVWRVPSCGGDEDSISNLNGCVGSSLVILNLEEVMHPVHRLTAIEARIKIWRILINV
jgi:hypothetical protein